MEAATVPKAGADHKLVVVWAQDGTAYMSTSTSSAPAVAESILAPLSSDHVTVLFVDDAAVQAALGVLTRSGRSDAVRIVSYLVRQSYAPGFCCLTRAMSRRWWSPFAQEGTLAQWGEAFGVTEVHPKEIARELYSFLSTGTDLPFDVAKSYGALRIALYSKSLAAQFRAYDASRALAEHWALVERTDPGLVERYYLTGEVVRCQPVSFAGEIATLRLSLPCRLRTGVVVVSNARFRHLAMTLLGFLAKDGRGDDGLYARVRISKRDKRYDLLSGSWRSCGTWTMTGAAFTPRLPTSRSMWLVEQELEPEGRQWVEGREVPLDVVLAGG